MPPKKAPAKKAPAKKPLRLRAAHAVVAGAIALAGVGTAGAVASTVPVRCSIQGVPPDKSCTPGALNPKVTQANINKTICVTGWTATVRPPVSYTDPLKTRNPYLQVWVIVVDPREPVEASVAVTGQAPGVVEAVYTTVAWPWELVYAVDGFTVPHVPAVVKLTRSPETGEQPVTVAVTLDVLLPSAGRLEGLAVTVALQTGVTDVCVMVTEPLPVEASDAVIVQRPGVVVAV